MFRVRKGPSLKTALNFPALLCISAGRIKPKHQIEMLNYTSRFFGSLGGTPGTGDDATTARAIFRKWIAGLDSKEFEVKAYKREWRLLVNETKTDVSLNARKYIFCEK